MRCSSNSSVKLGEHQVRMKTAMRVPGPNKGHHIIESKHFNWGIYYIVPYYVAQHPHNIVLRIGESLCLFLNLGPWGACFLCLTHQEVVKSIPLHRAKLVQDVCDAAAGRWGSQK